MVSPVVIGGFVAIDLSLFAQLIYALRDIEKSRNRPRHDGEELPQ